jgi:ribonuclease D
MSNAVPAPAAGLSVPPAREHYLTTAKLLYIRDAIQAEQALATLKGGPLGFDIEWPPNFRRGRQHRVALIQLATLDTVYLLQVSAMQEFPNRLREVLENPDIVKTGVGIQDDAKKLHTDYGVSTRTCVDLSLLARSVDNSRWKGRYTNAIGLSRLVDTYMHRYLCKYGQLSDWKALLTPLQQQCVSLNSHFSRF